MHEEIEDTNLVITGIAYSQSQQGLIRIEREERVLLLEVEDTVTGLKGHIYHEIMIDKRDIEIENFYTDTPELFANNHPETSEFQMYYCHVTDETPNTQTDEIGDIISNCVVNELRYDAANPDADTYEEQGWGLRIVGN